MMNIARRHSLTIHAWVAVFTISILCFISALGSGMLAWVSEADAQAINTAGSVRMATYRINFQLATDFSEDGPFNSNIGLKKNNLYIEDLVVNNNAEQQNKQQDELSPINKSKSEKINILIKDMENRLAKLREYQLANANDSDPCRQIRTVKLGRFESSSLTIIVKPHLSWRLIA